VGGQAQALATHIMPPLHTVPHPPQLFGSVLVTVHLLPHLT
jgi:hypothetical protein